MLPNTFYHIFNHANGDENLFRTDENYHFFLRRFAKYIDPIADSYAYCLMPNHFHFLIRIKDEDSLILLNPQGLKKNLEGFVTTDAFEFFVSQTFSNLFNSYTKSYNSVFGRKGALFQQNFKRKPITSDSYFTKVIQYIHANPVHHGFVKNIEDWPFSSYHLFLSNKETTLKRDEVFNWFHGKDEFLSYHRLPIFSQIDLDFE